jgi:hypothetical protein
MKEADQETGLIPAWWFHLEMCTSGENQALEYGTPPIRVGEGFPNTNQGRVEINPSVPPHEMAIFKAPLDLEVCLSPQRASVFLGDEQRSGYPLELSTRRDDRGADVGRVQATREKGKKSSIGVIIENSKETSSSR